MTAQALEELMRKARVAALPGSAHAPDRILLFPQIVAVLDEIHLRGAKYRQNRREIHIRIRYLKSVIWEARHEQQNFQFGEEIVRKLNAAWNDLETCLEDLERS